MKPEQLNDAIERYFALEEDIKKTLGWTDSWRLLPLVDDRDSYWMLAGGTKETGDGCTVVVSDEPITLKSAKEGKVSGSQIYTGGRDGPGIFRVGDVVLIPIDTQTDGNVLLSLLDAKKEIKNERIENCYRAHWGDGGDGDEDDDYEDESELEQ